MLLVPVLVVLILEQARTASYVAAAVLVLGGFSDGLDGYLARRHHMRTRTGAWLDPLSDKLLVVAPMLTLAALGRFPWWGAAAIVAREVAVTALRVARGARGTSMPASEIAKVKTGSQVLAVTLYVVPLSSNAGPERLAVLAFAVTVTLYSGVDYFVRALRPTPVP
jgi:CDP-diacylglycerol--glycerol-3-phosphate 3-phosphatidyltransferase